MSVHNHRVGNIGLYYVCYRLSRLGWNVMPTARNARGIDILAYNQDASNTLTLQVKSLSKRTPVPLGNTLDNLFSDFVVICRYVDRDPPECFVLKPAEIRKRVHIGKKNGKITHWLQQPDYEHGRFRDRWDRIGSGLSVVEAAVEN
jgi:hypothetical protein